MAYQLENKEILIDSDIVIGLKFPFNGRKVFNPTFTTLEQANSNIKNLLLTGRGERYLLHQFGTSLKYLLYARRIIDSDNYIIYSFQYWSRTVINNFSTRC